MQPSLDLAMTLHTPTSSRPSTTSRSVQCAWLRHQRRL